ncbi:putative 5-dehydro-4-deoxyglucarate dehydratase [Elstera cyanobacteriorum]|uniref:Probable 5-dehydro-4-deoxyglucarate dehydratase n=1 Tax=Elstera cyanobacteriorum TaxID=2022747 RepID=A0A255XT42_9PROT|nr:5-dehydro-4-deoxyglucarate dehydratase [Elstera cyanobacteriorum]OYQ20159.1 5-dehydro-4-deoxyglucarate dehydratase [Elstera cyanobacteriorum]GFZ81346.1 putative 5-dehydro-4-deoxyglucarate dehydratase [Elstera cyanobacteriorum]
MDPQALKTVLDSGLLSFPLTDFDADGNFNPAPYRARLDWLKPYGASALFAAGGTGEFFSLTPAEHEEVIRVAVETCKDDVPIIAGTGYGTRLAIDLARQAEKAGAAGLLVLPHYLTEADQDGVRQHVTAICKSVGIGVIVYNRAGCRLGPDAIARIADDCPNFIGFKDGLGEIELMTAIYRKMGSRLAYLGGLPTAELYAEAYKAMGVPVYSSAVFNFIPRTAVEFYKAVAEGDSVTTGRFLDEFILPYSKIRNRRAGYAVSIVKAGATLVGRSAGPVRTPLVDLTPDEVAELKVLIDKLGPQ